MMKEILDELRAQQRALIAETAAAQLRVDRTNALIARLMRAQEQAERKALGIAAPDAAPSNGEAA